ncbi:MAG: hypothetical protein AAGJ18_18310, partial [Bacteroidota bacterium]
EVYSLQSLIDNDGFLDDEILWLNNSYKVCDFVDIGKILKKEKSWSDLIILYGNQDSNRFEVYTNEDEIVFSVSFRIDMRTNYEEILRKLIEFFIAHNFVILDENLKKVPLNFLSFKTTIENSSQLKKYKMFFKKEKD